MSLDNSNISLFPLNIFILPGERVELHIFEPRYRQLLREVQRTDMPFGIPYVAQDKSMKVGSLVKLVQVKKHYSTGELDIVVESKGIFRLESFDERKRGKLYPGGTISMLNTLGSKISRKKLKHLFHEFLLAHSGGDMIDLPDYNLSILDLACSLSLSHEDKVKLIQIEDANLQEKFLEKFVEYLLLLEQQEKAVEDGLYLN